MVRVRYVKQRDKYSCGPVAIMNVLKWVGVKFTYNTRIKVLQEICNCIPIRGTKHAAFDKAFRRTMELLPIDIRVRRVHRPKLKQIEDHLRSKGIVILNYRWQSKGVKGISRHFMLLTKIYGTGKYFLVVNDYSDGPAAHTIHRKTLKTRNLCFQRVDPHYKGWFISLKSQKNNHNRGCQ